MSLDKILAAFKEGQIDLDQVKKEVTAAQLYQLEEVVLDLKREERCGLPEIVYGHAKNSKQILMAAKAILEHSKSLLVTRVSKSKAAEILPSLPGCSYCDESKSIYLFPKNQIDGQVLIVTAGTSDVYVAKEAQMVCQMFGVKTILKPDLGVAALNRILSISDELQSADCIIVCAGMEAALPSVVGGLVSVPIIAVPVSSGYGSSLGGLTALLGMLNSCSSGLTVVNIDNGFGAGYAAGRILKAMNDGLRK